MHPSLKALVLCFQLSLNHQSLGSHLERVTRVCETFCKCKCTAWELTSTPGFVHSFILVQTMSSGFHVSKETGALQDPVWHSQHRTQTNTGFNNNQEEAHWPRTQWTNQSSTSLDGLSEVVLLSCNKKFYRIISQAVLCHLILSSNEFPLPLFSLFLKLFSLRKNQHVFPSMSVVSETQNKTSLMLSEDQHQISDEFVICLEVCVLPCLQYSNIHNSQYSFCYFNIHMKSHVSVT